jgi:ferritin
MLKIISYINERGGQATIPAFEKPPVDFKSVQPMFEQVLHHEEYVSASINEIVAVCERKRISRHITGYSGLLPSKLKRKLLQGTYLIKLNMLGDGPLYMFDRDIMSLTRS